MSKTTLTEKRIQKILNGFFASWKYNIDGLFVFRWESDKLLWTKAGYIYEFEIKISRADYKNDFKHKAAKHILMNSVMPESQSVEQDLFDNLQSQQQKRYPMITAEQAKRYCYPQGTRMPNYFYYAVPEGMLQEDEVPPYAGLVYVSESGQLKIIRNAPCLHKEKYTDAELNLCEKFYYNMKTWQRNYREQVGYSLMYRERLQDELASKHQEKSYKELQDELKAAEDNVQYYKNDAKNYYGLYKTMVEGADYNSIERRMLVAKIKELDPNFIYSAFTEEVEKKYKERYPNRK